MNLNTSLFTCVAVDEPLVQLTEGQEVAPDFDSIPIPPPKRNTKRRSLVPPSSLVLSVALDELSNDLYSPNLSKLLMLYFRGRCLKSGVSLVEENRFEF